MDRKTSRNAPADMVERLHHATHWNFDKCNEMLARVPTAEQEAFVREMELDDSFRLKHDGLSKRRR